MEPNLEMIDTGRVRLRVAVAGSGPLVVLIHGFPEGWYSWRHQIRALVDAGYLVAAPDVRGYGDSDKPNAIEAYAIKELAADIDALIEALAARQAIVIGHDWGASITYATALFHPHRVAALAGLSVPHLGRGSMPSVELFRKIYKDRFFYQLYFQEPGVAEAELEADVRTSLRKIYYWSSGDARKIQANPPNPTKTRLLEGLKDPDPFPAWLGEADLDYCTEQLRRSGFRGPLNRYRNSARDFADLAAFDETKIAQPAAFLAGSLEPVLGMVPGLDMIEVMGLKFGDLRYVKVIDGAGHWVQQERPAEVNAALLEFLASL
jgi:pimeloyl-ACP methyl ester carboxylesterase